MILSLDYATLERLTEAAQASGSSAEGFGRLVLLWAARNEPVEAIRFWMRYQTHNTFDLDVRLDAEELGPVLDVARENGGFGNPRLGGLLKACLESFLKLHPDLAGN